jgi:hypothetical protein
MSYLLFVSYEITPAKALSRILDGCLFSYVNGFKDANQTMFSQKRENFVNFYICSSIKVDFDQLLLEPSILRFKV